MQWVFHAHNVCYCTKLLHNDVLCDTMCCRAKWTPISVVSKLSLISWMLYFKSIWNNFFWNAPDTVCYLLSSLMTFFFFFILHWTWTTWSFIIFGRQFYNFKHQISIEYFAKDSYTESLYWVTIPVTILRFQYFVIVYDLVLRI